MTTDTKAIRAMLADTESPDTIGLTEEQARIVTCDRTRRVSSLAHEWRAHTAALLAENERLRAALSDVIGCDHHNFFAGPPPKFVQIARAALAQEGGE